MHSRTIQHTTYAKHNIQHVIVSFAWRLLAEIHLSLVALVERRGLALVLGLRADGALVVVVRAVARRARLRPPSLSAS